jgi:hypothetical protein
MTLKIDLKVMYTQPRNDKECPKIIRPKEAGWKRCPLLSQPSK